MFGSRCQLYNPCQGFVPISRSVSTERYYRFTFEIIALRKGVDNHRSCPPPYGTANEYRIILLPIFDFLFDGGAGIGFFFGLCNLGARCVLGGIRLLRLDTEKRTTRECGYMFRDMLRITSPTEVGNKNFFAGCSFAGAFCAFAPALDSRTASKAISFVFISSVV